MTIGEFFRVEPGFDLFSGNEPRLRRVELVEHVEDIALEGEFAPVIEVLIERKAGEREQVDRVDRNVQKRGEHPCDPQDDVPRKMMDQNGFHGFQKPSVEGVPLQAIDPDDDAAAGFAVLRDIPERRGGIIGVMKDADRIDDIELATEVHRRDVRFDERNATELRGPFPGA